MSENELLELEAAVIEGQIILLDDKFENIAKEHGMTTDELLQEIEDFKKSENWKEGE